MGPSTYGVGAHSKLPWYELACRSAVMPAIVSNYFPVLNGRLTVLVNVIICDPVILFCI